MSDPQVGETAEKVVAKVETAVKAAKKLVKKVKAKAAKPTKKEAPKKAPQKAKELVKIKGAQLLKKGPGPATKAWAKKFRADREPGQCNMKGCSRKTVTPRAKWCAPHKKEVRKAQLKANNVVWRKAVKEGRAGHHVVYDGQATVFTLQNKNQAEKIVLAGRATVTTKTELEKAIRAVPMAARKEARAT